VSGDNELGLCLRAWRERLSPTAVGLPQHGHRRTSGLRREELSALADLSVDYLIRLEQGRASNPSPQVTAGLARALRLTDDERDHLYRVAGHAPPGRHQVPTHITPGVQRLLDRLDAAVSVHDAGWTVLAWNPAWAALMGDPSSLTGRDRNIIWRHFLGPPGRLVRTPAEVTDFERIAVSDLRAVFGRYPLDEGLRAFITDLRRASPEFARHWASPEVADLHADRKTFRHPEVGQLTLDCDVLTVSGSDLRVVAYTAVPGSVDAELFDLIRVIGLQHLSPA
jgi:transcriptional regulator with XRE-family HTH domain